VTDQPEVCLQKGFPDKYPYIINSLYPEMGPESENLSLEEIIREVADAKVWQEVKMGSVVGKE
jgi:hypothetical protein